MSNTIRTTAPQSVADTHRAMFAKAEKELAEGFVEIEITGLSFRRLVSVYAVLVRHAWLQTVAGLRSLLRPDPAHQA